MKSSAWYAIVVGALILALWFFMILKGQVPELQTEPLATGFHIAAEAILGLALLAGGLGSLQAKPWSHTTLLLSLGMLVYSAVNSAGYYAQAGNWGFVALFAAILISAIWMLLRLAPEEMEKHRRHGR